MKEWRAKNREKVAEHKKTYSDNNKDKLSKYLKQYRQTPAGKKSETVSKWKQRGLIHDDYCALYDSYLEATHCNACKSEFKDSRDRCLDHDHNTGLFRQFLCQACNGFDRWLLLD